MLGETEANSELESALGAGSAQHTPKCCVPDSRILTGLLPAGQRPGVSLSASGPNLLPVCLQESEGLPAKGHQGSWANGRGLPPGLWPLGTGC